MTSFSQFLLAKKFSQLNHSQESVETLSFWMIHHRRYAAMIVKYWSERFIVVSESRKLAFMFVVNDILKSSKDKNKEYHKEFEKVLPDAFWHVANNCTSKELFNHIQRMLNIWQNHRFFQKHIIKNFRNFLEGNLNEKETEQTTKACENTEAAEVIELEDEIDPKKLKKIFLASDAPGPEELIAALESLENMPSADRKKRAEIANLPKKYSDAEKLKRIKDTKEADEFGKKLTKVILMVDKYNERLDAEIAQREKVNKMLHAYKESELERISDVEHQLAQVESELENISLIRDEIQCHRNSLPDMKGYSNVETLPPLPSANVLFKKL